MKKSNLIWLAVIVIILIVVVSVSGHKTPAKPATASSQPIKIGAALALSGDAAIWGEASKNGIDLAVKDINAKGGAGGRPVEVIYEDMHSSAASSVTAVQKLQNIDRVDALIVTWLDVYGGPESVLKPHTLMISPDAGTEGVNGTAVHPNVFSTWYRTAPKTELAVQHMASHGVKKLYVIIQNDSYYTTMFGMLKTSAAKNGITIVGQDILNADQDVGTVLAKVKASKADAVFVALYDEKENIDFLKKHQSFLGTSIKLYGDEFILQNYARADYNPQWFEGFYFYAPKQPDQAFFNAYIAAYKTDPIFGASPAYDTVHMIAQAVAANPADYNDYMRKTTFDTVSYGPVTFDAIGGIATPQEYFVMKQVVKGKAIESK